MSLADCIINIMEEVKDYEMEDGGLYTGVLSNGIPDGKGRIVWKHKFTPQQSEDVFEGVFVKGKSILIRIGRRHGPGKKINADGSFFDGHYKDDMPHGQGHYKWVDGEEYKGRPTM